MKLHRSLTTLIAAALLCASGANAIPVRSSTAAQMTFRDCIAGTTACDSISGALTRTFDGDPGDLSASASQTDAAFGSASGSVQLSGVIGAPILSAIVTSEAGKRNGSNVVALQRYTYTGTSATTRTFGGSLAYDQSVPLDNGRFPNPLATQSGVFATLKVFALAGDFFETGVTAQDNFLALSEEFLTASGLGTLLGADSFEDSLSTRPRSESLGVVVPLNPGDSVWVAVLLQAIGANGAEVHVSSFVTGWDDTAGLAAANAVPEPGTLALLGLSLAGFGLARRRAS